MSICKFKPFERALMATIDEEGNNEEFEVLILRVIPKGKGFSCQIKHLNERFKDHMIETIGARFLRKPHENDGDERDLNKGNIFLPI